MNPFSISAAAVNNVKKDTDAKMTPAKKSAERAAAKKATDEERLTNTVTTKEELAAKKEAADGFVTPYKERWCPWPCSS